MGHIQGRTRSGASLRIVFGDGVVSLPLSAATTFGDIARTVRGLSAQRRSAAAAVAVIFSGGRTAERAFLPRGCELPDTALLGRATAITRASFDA